MKKLILIMASSLIGLGAFAQEGFHIGVKGGMLGTCKVGVHCEKRGLSAIT